MKRINSLLITIMMLFVFIGCGDSTRLDGERVSDIENNHGSIEDTSMNETAKTIYAKCAGCHGQNGEKSALGKSDVIGGDNKEAILYSLEEYKAGRLNQYGMGALMKGQVTALTHSELESVSEYISKLSGV